MKHLLVVSNMYPSPAEPYFGVFVERQVDALRSLGEEVVLAVSSRQGGSAAAAASKYWELSRTAWRAMRPKPRAVIAHFAFPTGAVALASARRRAPDAPVVVVVHGGDVAPGKPETIRRATHAVLSRADIVAAVSRAIASDAIAAGATPGRVTVASMGYDAGLFVPRDRATARARLGLDPVKKYAVLVGNLIERKGIAIAISAAGRLRAREPALQWIFVGGGDAARWKQQASHLGDSVRFAGAALPAEVPWWLAAADVAIVPSLREPFGVAAVEALACAIPVVASNTGGLAEIVTDGRTGLLVQAGDSDGLAAAVLAVAGDANLAARLSAAGLEAARPHTAVSQAQKLLDTIAAAALRRRGAP